MRRTHAGGFSEDDQHVGLIVSNPAIIGQNFTANVTTTQVETLL
jgi:hypothetical protein